MDMLFDHLLACNWREFHQQTISDFVQQVYRELDVERHLMPERAARVSLAMSHGDWLSNYHKVEGLKRALQGISNRLGHRFDLVAAVDDLSGNREQLQANFLEFYFDLQNQMPGMVIEAMKRAD
jgi:acyl carrier protein phosphodiesterase